MMSYWEFRSETLDAVAGVASAALSGAKDKDVALREIDQLCAEGELTYEDGERIEDNRLVELVTRHYGEPRKPSWGRSAVSSP
jgi:hypothetical protein